MPPLQPQPSSNNLGGGAAGESVHSMGTLTRAEINAGLAVTFYHHRLEQTVEVILTKQQQTDRIGHPIATVPDGAPRQAAIRRLCRSFECSIGRHSIFPFQSSVIGLLSISLMLSEHPLEYSLTILPFGINYTAPSIRTPILNTTLTTTPTPTPTPPLTATFNPLDTRQHSSTALVEEVVKDRRAGRFKHRHGKKRKQRRSRASRNTLRASRASVNHPFVPFLTLIFTDYDNVVIILWSLFCFLLLNTISFHA